MCQMMVRAHTAMRHYLHYLGKINERVGNKTLYKSGVTLLYYTLFAFFRKRLIL